METNKTSNSSLLGSSIDNGPISPFSSPQKSAQSSDKLHNLQSLYAKGFGTSTRPVPIDPIEVCLSRIKALILYNTVGSSPH